MRWFSISFKTALIITWSIFGWNPENVIANNNINDKKPIKRIYKNKLVYRIKEDTGLVWAAKKVCRNQEVQKDITHLEEEIAKGNDKPGIGWIDIGSGIIEHRRRNGGIIYIRDRGNNVIEILGK